MYFATTHDLWLCLHCRNEIFPFNSVDDHELVELLVYNSNTDSLCSDKISRLNLESLPCFDISTFINNNPNLSSIDIDLNLPSVTIKSKSRTCFKILLKESLISNY